MHTTIISEAEAGCAIRAPGAVVGLRSPVVQVMVRDTPEPLLFLESRIR